MAIGADSSKAAAPQIASEPSLAERLCLDIGPPTERTAFLTVTLDASTRLSISYACDC